MFSGLLGAVPLFWKVPVLLVFVLLIMFCLILLAGYRLRLPLWLGELSPAQPSSSASLTAELEELRKLLLEGRKASSALQDLRHQQPLGAGDGRALYRGAAVEELVDTVDHGEEDSGASRKLSLEFKTMTLEDRLQTSSLPGTPRKTLPPSTPVRGLGTLGQASESARPTTPLRGLETLSYGAGAAPLPSTPLRGLSRGVVALTPVKNRVMGQPEVLRPVDLTREEEVLDLRKTEEQEGERDLRSEEEVVDLRKREDREVQLLRKEEVLALRKEDSDDDLLNIEEELREPAVLMTPKKELVVIGNPASPSTTSFDWMVEERNEDKQVQQVLVVEEKEEDEKVQEVMASAGRQGAEFLDKVEDIFHKEESL